MRALDIDVPDALAARWSDWFTPARRPFVAPAALAVRLGLPDERGSLAPEERDASGLYGLAEDDAVVRLDRAAYEALSPGLRAELHKRSQCWFSPVKVLAVDGVKSGGRAPGRRLHRYRVDAD